MKAIVAKQRRRSVLRRGGLDLGSNNIRWSFRKSNAPSDRLPPRFKLLLDGSCFSRPVSTI